MNPQSSAPHPIAQRWLLKKGSEKKFKAGHPWVFSSELAQSPKGILPGDLVELRDYQGHFLARGYGHPHSLISFRTLSRAAETPIDLEFFKARLLEASELRRRSGIFPWSHRLVFAEGDYLPGLIIDRFRLAPSADLKPGGQVFVIQCSTSGTDRLLPSILEALESLVQTEGTKFASWETTSIVIANDSKSRAMEGLPAEPKRLLRGGEGFYPEKARLVAQPSLSGLSPAIFETDFLGGQKTGFFLDQRFNIQLTAALVANMNIKGNKIRVLDLCCYVGQWGSHLAHVISSIGGRAEITLVDASAKALAFAATNVAANGGDANTVKTDVMEAMDQFDPGTFDIVICDPPAFIKKKKDHPAGATAYYKLNREAARRVRPGGIFVSCSCSGLFTEDDFRSMLAKVAATSREIRWLARGGHSADHPQRPEFPQGTYLKAWMGVVS